MMGGIFKPSIEKSGHSRHSAERKCFSSKDSAATSLIEAIKLFLPTTHYVVESADLCLKHE